ncbi:RNA polymerase sigma factor [Paenibacillus albidus]|uniref:RNA polymerase sigma factor n=1 Tax=Paenibacillus albidus TaxID=2041023 RepID=UPI001BE6C1E7|nr:RNA polymerase sigma factor [Paenibacillus albidus]MBT2291991.1 RNA polymerase sigma factor [Paenibacillus albidus]
MEEEEWIKRIQQGETQYLTLLIERHYLSIQKYCYWKIRSMDDAEDLTQETFFRFCSKTDHLNNEGKYLAYLYTIARNVCWDYLRNKRRTQLVETIERADSQAIEMSSMEDQVDNEQIVHQLLQTLPEEQRELVFMRFCLDLTYKDIARITRMNQWVVQYKIKRGLNTMKQYRERKEIDGEKASLRSSYAEKLPFTSG